jgi:hypothetical protein
MPFDDPVDFGVQPAGVAKLDGDRAAEIGQQQLK